MQIFVSPSKLKVLACGWTLSHTAVEIQHSTDIHKKTTAKVVNNKFR